MTAAFLMGLLAAAVIAAEPQPGARQADVDAVNAALNQPGPPQVEPVFATRSPLYRPDLVKWFGPVGGFFPNRAYRASVSGTVVLQCAVSAAGKLSGCATLIESPAGWNFSDAAMAMIKKDYLTVTPALGAKDGDQARILIQFPNHSP